MYSQALVFQAPLSDGTLPSHGRANEPLRDPRLRLRGSAFVLYASLAACSHLPLKETNLKTAISVLRQCQKGPSSSGSRPDAPGHWPTKDCSTSAPLAIRLPRLAAVPPSSDQPRPASCQCARRLSRAGRGHTLGQRSGGRHYRRYRGGERLTARDSMRATGPHVVVSVCSH